MDAINNSGPLEEDLVLLAISHLSHSINSSFELSIISNFGDPFTFWAVFILAWPLWYGVTFYKMYFEIGSLCYPEWLWPPILNPFASASWVTGLSTSVLDHGAVYSCDSRVSAEHFTAWSLSQEFSGFHSLLLEHSSSSLAILRHQLVQSLWGITHFYSLTSYANTFPLKSAARNPVTI